MGILNLACGLFVPAGPRPHRGYARRLHTSPACRTIDGRRGSARSDRAQSVASSETIWSSIPRTSASTGGWILKRAAASVRRFGGQNRGRLPPRGRRGKDQSSYWRTLASAHSLTQVPRSRLFDQNRPRVSGQHALSAKKCPRSMP